MFRYAGMLLSVFFILMCYALFAWLMPSRVNDKREYEQLLKESISEDDSLKADYQGTQQRKHVIKEVWYQDEQRLHFRLSCASSKLEFMLLPQSSEIVEKMIDVSCWMQEELFYQSEEGTEVRYDTQTHRYYRLESHETKEKIFISDEEVARLKPFQKIRKLNAQDATYYFTTGLFEADEVLLERYVLEGHELPSHISHLKPQMKGIARSVSFALSGKFLNFNAKHLKATFFNPSN